MDNEVVEVVEPTVKLTLFDQVKDALKKHLGAQGEVVNELEKAGDEFSLVARAMVSEMDLAKVYAELTGLKVLDGDDFENVESFGKISLEYLRNYHALPVSWDDDVIIAVGMPYKRAQIAHDLQLILGLKVKFVYARFSLIERLQTSLYETHEEEMFNWDSDGSEEALQNLAKEAPVVRFVNDTFSRALDMDASDIHIEPLDHNFVVRYRVDGMLQTVSEMPLNMFAAVSSRIKLIGGMNIAEHRLPQDGRTEMQIGKNKIDVRISSVPSTDGESIVMRILKKDVQNFTLASIGMSRETELKYTSTIKLPHGIVLVVGPTGSGKSTTLYCSMNILNNDSNKILTVEDPVEYQIAGITQVHVKQSIGLTFASALRSFLRQDPDIILVGEIRDRETAEIAINAALTGHLVLSTLHTNDAAGAVSRLQDMGVENFLISSALIGVLSQRLVRKLCPVCSGSGQAFDRESGEQKRCRNCGGNGFKGRLGIFEFLEVSDRVRKAINANKDSSEIAAIAKSEGMITLREDGALKAKQGVTTAAEVSRVCQLDSE